MLMTVDFRDTNAAITNAKKHYLKKLIYFVSDPIKKPEPKFPGSGFYLIYYFKVNSEVFKKTIRYKHKTGFDFKSRSRRHKPLYWSCKPHR